MEIVLDLGEGVHELNTWSRDAASFGRMGFPGVFRGVWVIYTGDEYGATLYPPRDHATPNNDPTPQPRISKSRAELGSALVASRSRDYCAELDRLSNPSKSVWPS